MPKDFRYAGNLHVAMMQVQDQLKELFERVEALEASATTPQTTPTPAEQAKARKAG